MLARIRDILVITTPDDQPHVQKLLGDGSQLGINLPMRIQPAPEVSPRPSSSARLRRRGAGAALILGDNIFFGFGFPELLASAAAREEQGATVFGYRR